MQLVRAHLVHLGPFQNLDVSLADDGEARLLTVVHGGGGVGKTTLLQGIAGTRPGYAVALPNPESRSPAPHVIAEWSVGQEDPERPHPLIVSSPNVRAFDEDSVEAFRRKEQAVFERLAKRGRGFAFVTVSSARWFSRQPFSMHAPGRSLGRYDVRQVVPPDDATRADLARETKQSLAYAALSSAVAQQHEVLDDEADAEAFSRLGTAMRSVVNRVVALADHEYLGVDPRSFEPTFQGPSGTVVFDRLPSRARHLVALAALPTRAFWAAAPDLDPREAEGVVCIDEVDLHQDPSILPHLMPTLRAALPRAQWIVTATSSLVASSCEVNEVLALRKNDEGSVQLHDHAEAVVH